MLVRIVNDAHDTHMYVRMYAAEVVGIVKWLPVHHYKINMIQFYRLWPPSDITIFI